MDAKTVAAKAPGFERPIQRPANEDEHRIWQVANRAWWEAAPMRYDSRECLNQASGSAAYFAEIDRRFLSAAREFIPWRKHPFDALIPFDRLGEMAVLEIGVGHGTHAQLLATHSRSFVGIDLTRTAAAMTAKRLHLFGVAGLVAQMDAESMAFRDASFDYVWSWGVIHHSADTARALAEIHRVLRPGGRCTVMVYYRSWWNYYASDFLRRMLFESWRGPHFGNDRKDGAISRYYKPREWRAVAEDFFEIDAVKICGMKSDVVPLPYGKLKQFVMRLLPSATARFLTGRLRMGSMLVVSMSKPLSC